VAFHVCYFRICKCISLNDQRQCSTRMSGDFYDNSTYLLPYFFQSPGQEEGNVPYVEESGFGAYSSDPRVIAETVRGWLASPETMAKLQNAAFTASRPSATLDIAKDLADMVFKTKPALLSLSRGRDQRRA
jgi:hypothetical protein